MQNSQPTLTTFGQNTTLFCPRALAKLGADALKPIRPSVYWFV